MTVTDYRTASVRRALAATLILGSSAALLAGCAGRDFATTRDSATAPDSATQVAALRASLIRIGREDQAGRDSTAIAFANRDTIFLARLMQGDSARTRWLEGTIAAHGWPRRSVVGDSAADAAWLVVQHSPDLGFQERMLVLVLQGEAARGEVGAADVGMLDDRVLAEMYKVRVEWPPRERRSVQDRRSRGNTVTDRRARRRCTARSSDRRGSCASHAAHRRRRSRCR